MIASIHFEFPLAIEAGLPTVAVLLALAAWLRSRRGVPFARAAPLIALRALALLLLVFLAARPIWLSRADAAAARSVVVLLDRSESMSIRDGDSSRYAQALDFLRERLLPAFKSANLPVEGLLFDQSAELADGAKFAAAEPNGKRTNLGGAIAQGLANAAQPPLAVIALTDGSVNEGTENNRALAGLLDSNVPFIGVGFGSDKGVPTLSLRQVDAPPTVTTKTAFSVSAQLELINSHEMPPFELLLLRDGQIHQKKTVNPVKSSRLWLENFQVTESQQGLHNYSVQLLPPDVPDLKCINALGNTSVRVSDEKELRVLYIQGSLTWDYKFISMALHNDPTIKLTGLTRTSKQSVFRQNVESAGELMNGFPSTLEELAPFRVLILSNLRPADLTPAQQEMLARYCGELGGGILMIGGPATFDSSWQNSRLEQLLPVVFTANAGVQGLDRPFRIQLSDIALEHPVFQIGDNHSSRELWAQLPTFTQYGRVDAAKPGAQVWMTHQTDEGPHGRRILMASQRYGAGLSAVLCIQNFWRWRLAKDSDPLLFDRFWRQLFRFLSEVGRQEVAIHLADQELRAPMDLQMTLEKQPNPKNITDTSHKFFVRVEDPKKELLRDETVELEPSRPADFTFHAEAPGIYTVTVLDAFKAPVATRPVEIRDISVEFQNTARDMETLRQWASVSGGLALKVEDCRDAGELVRQIKTRIEQARQQSQQRHPLCLNGWVLTLLLASLGGEWVLRKRWNLT